MGKVDVGHYVIGMVGLALLRGWLTGTRSAADARTEDLARLLGDGGPLGLELDAPESDARTGYARWAETYDARPNPLIAVEEEVVRRMIEPLPRGTALDAACGTGRHTRHLRDRGHRVTGVDASHEMLAVARAALPDVELREGALTALPFDDATFDLAVCALALTHLPEVGGAIAELARVIRPGGRLIVSDFHPAMALIGGSALFFDSAGRAGYVTSHHHPHGSYLRAFRDAGLEVLDCVEPVIGPEHVKMASAGMSKLAPEAFQMALVGWPEALVWELARRP